VSSTEVDGCFSGLRILTQDNCNALAARRQEEKTAHGLSSAAHSHSAAAHSQSIAATNNREKKLTIDYALSNSFAFGGSNASILMKKYTP